MQTPRHTGGRGLNPYQAGERGSNHLICKGKNNNMSLMVLGLDDLKKYENHETCKGKYFVNSEIL